MAGNLRITEVRISGEERFALCHNPLAAARDAALRARLLARMEEMIAAPTPYLPPGALSCAG